MKFIETNKHRHIEKDTMELAMAWYHRYTEKLDQMEEIDKRLREFEEWMTGNDDGTVLISELQKAWNKSFNF